MSFRDRDSTERGKYRDSRDSRDRNYRAQGGVNRNDRRSRERPRSRSRDRSNSKDRSSSYKDHQKDKGGRHHDRGKDGRGRGSRSRSRSPAGRDIRDRDNRDEFGRIRAEDRKAPVLSSSATSQPPIQLARASIDQVRRERMELVKSLTGDGDEKSKKKRTKTNEDDEAMEGEVIEGEEDDEDEDMAELLGFSGFSSTKGKPVAANHVGAAVGAVSKHKARKYRQYMNRRGGFNRPLDKID